MGYSIGEISQQTGIAISALRYYDKEGLFPSMGRSHGGSRVFSDKEIATLKMIDCLKATGMPIQDIRQFIDWCEEGDSTLGKRLEMFQERLQVVTEQMAASQKTMNTVKYKCWYYSTACAAGSEEAPRKMSGEEMPAEIARYKREFLGD